jgi:type IV secretory pathway VirB2 component (pilin)
MPLQNSCLTTGQTVVNGVCSCPTGQTPINGACTTTPTSCPIVGQTLVGGTCSCPTGQSVINGACGCPTGQTSVNNVCTVVQTCPTGQTLVGGTCTTPTTNTTYQPLAQLPSGNGTMLTTIDTQKSTSNPCPFGNYLNIMIKLVIGFAAVLAMIMIIAGGIEYMTSELVSSKESGKETILHAILGLLIALIAYTLLNTINPQLLSACLNTLPQATITIDDNPQTPISTPNGTFYCTGTAGATTTINGATVKGYQVGSPSNQNWLKIAGSPASLPSGVTVLPSGDCSYVGQPNCTSIDGLNPDKVDAIATACGSKCSIIITGGTECWLHGSEGQSTTHHPNSDTVDLRATPQLNAFFNNGNTNFPNDGKTHTNGDVTCLAETAGATTSTTGSHWHCGS